MASHRFKWNFASLKGLPQNLKRQTGFFFGYFREEIDHSPRFFLVFTKEIGNRFKMGKMYEALTALTVPLYTQQGKREKTSRNR